MSENVTIYGLSRSLPILLIFIIAFVGLSYIFTMLIFDDLFISIIGGAVALSLCGLIYGCIRYYAEQIIAYTTVNTDVIIKRNSGKDE